MLLKDIPAMGEVVGRSVEHRIEVALTEEVFACSGSPRGTMEFVTHTFAVAMRGKRGGTCGRGECHWAGRGKILSSQWPLPPISGTPKDRFSLLMVAMNGVGRIFL